MSDDLQRFLADKWGIHPGPGGPTYALLSDAALAVANLDTAAERRAALAHFAGELVAHAVAAGLDLSELRRLGVNLQNDLFDAMIWPSACPACGAEVPGYGSGDRCPACGAKILPF